ncbi:hypothetical protein AJ79_02752 [Helicocarpus griseus UAMH5409]|uniref:Fe2OG dioxygenase domain-containing protein n=1 Tax=Helicocarpus griseus UAMH5409 TaxID=1447875 RepID=A0A2B7Y144_9EURO|nr:hypothetical protein AJ79_02752 [Helicocarpus griseus UAMH5409]
MATTFSSLPIVDLTSLKNPSAGLSREERNNLASQLFNVFATTGFAYLVNHPLSFDHEALFELCREYFALPIEEKMKLAKKSFCKDNLNTYRGYFPTQPDLATDNLKEGFEIGPPNLVPRPSTSDGDTNAPKISLSEPNVWPAPSVFPSRPKLEQLYHELQSLSSTLLSILAVSLGKDADFFASYLTDSLSTLRLLHYPPNSSMKLSTSAPGEKPAGPKEKLSCTPHTDSGILTLLHQDATGGLEVQDAGGNWVAAPYVPGSIVVNIGDLMAKVSGGRFVATMHRVRAPAPAASPNKGENGGGRFSVPFFFEPGEKCVIRSVDDEDGVDAVVYGDHVRAKMKTWVEFRDL